MAGPKEARKLPSPSPLEGRTVVVTGAGGPVGSGLARAVTEAGGSVALVGDDRAAVQELASDLRRQGASAIDVICSLETLARSGGAEDAFAAAGSALGPPHGLVHASVAESALSPGAFVEVDDERWASVWELTMLSTLRCLQAAYRSFAGRGGRVVVVVPTVSMSGAAGLAPLAAASEGQRLLAKSAARQWGPDGVTVNCIAPAVPVLRQGPAEGRGAPGDPPARPGGDEEGRGGPREGPVALAPRALGRPGDPRRDLGPLAVFLLGEPAPFLTGVTLCADGGLWMAP